MTQDHTPADWRRPPGVSEGIWQYVHQRSIARHYGEFVADTPLCDLDHRFLCDHFKRYASDQPASNQVIVDLGAGTGRLAIPLSKLGFNLIAVDLSQSMLEELLRQLPSAPVTKSETRQQVILPMRANLVELDSIRESVADHAICMFSTLGMIQGQSNRIRFLCHANRIVRPGGTMIVHVHRRWAALRESGNALSLIESWIRSIADRGHEFGDTVYAYRGLDKMFMHRFSSAELRSDLSKSGWRVSALHRIDLTGSDFTNSRWNCGGYLVVCSKPT